MNAPSPAGRSPHGREGGPRHAQEHVRASGPVPCSGADRAAASVVAGAEAKAASPVPGSLGEAAQRVLAVTRGAWFPSEASLRLRAELHGRLSPLAAHATDDGTAATLVLASVLESLVHALPPEIRWVDQQVRMSERLAQAVVRRDAAGMSSALSFLLHGQRSSSGPSAP